MRVSILTPDVSENSLGRAHVLARLLRPEFKVEAVGPQVGQGVWAPVADDPEFHVRGVPMKQWGLASGVSAWRQIADSIDADAVYVSKPFATALWTAGRCASRGVSPLLDIDDWELGMHLERRSRRSRLDQAWRAAATLGSLHHRASWNVRLGERMAHGAWPRTVSGRFLERRFGGTVVWHSRDTDAFRPGRTDVAAERASLGLPADAPVVVFVGTPAPYKGLDDLVQAVARSRRQAELLVVGLDDSATSKSVSMLARDALGRRAHLLGPQPFARLPALLELADVVCIPQRESPATVGQMPAKLFDAMALGKPVVATRVSDIPEVLADTGVVVSPSAPAELTSAIDGLLANPDEARALGAAARTRCVELYSDHAMRRVLVPFVKSCLG